MSFSSYIHEIVHLEDGQKSRFLTSFQRKTLLKNLQNNLPSEYQRRIEIILLADMGKSQAAICEIVGCSQEMARYWSGIAEAGMAHKWNERKIGRPKIVNNEYLARLKELVNNSPREYGYAFSSWTARWLSKHLAKELGIEISDRHINRLLKQMGLSTKSRTSSNQENTENQDSNIRISDLSNSFNAKSESFVSWSFNSISSHS